MSIAVDNVENSALPAREEEIEKITEVQITSVGTACGYVLRLADGRFVIFDGGMPEQSRAIYDILKSQNVLEGEPVIAAWFLTHGHQDHIGAPLKFIERYQDRVEIETFVHNLPAYVIYNEKNTAEKKPEVESENLYYQSEMYYSKIEAFYPDSDIVVAHAGQRFEYGDIDIDVLFTTENIYKKQMYDTNMSSVVYSITGSSGRMIILGDAQDIQCPTINAIYPDFGDVDMCFAHLWAGNNALDEESYMPILKEFVRFHAELQANNIFFVICMRLVEVVLICGMMDMLRLQKICYQECYLTVRLLFLVWGIPIP